MSFPSLKFPLVIALAALYSCSKKKHDHFTPPNIVWINAEDISPAFGCYGDVNAKTPNIDALAKNGALVFENVFTTSPICSPSRSTMISGIHSTTLGTQHLRSNVARPDHIKALPEILRKAGYFTSIFGKTDYNFEVDGFWEYWEDDFTPWRQRQGDSPFFSKITVGLSHEGTGNNREAYQRVKADMSELLYHDSLSVKAPPYFPKSVEFDDLWTRYYDLVSAFDEKVGVILGALEEDELLENTIVFVFSDHGFGMPRYKRWLYSSGLHVPLVVHIPERYKKHYQFDLSGRISFVDLAPTVLQLAGVNVPSYMQGESFLFPQGQEMNVRSSMYASRSRADNMYEMSRAVIKDDYIFIRHFMPYQPYIQSGKIFSDKKESLKYLREYRRSGKLPSQSENMFTPKPIEELYYLVDDPYELNDLSGDPAFHDRLLDMRRLLRKKAIETNDVGFYHEVEMTRLAKGRSPYELGLDTMYLKEMVSAADLVGRATLDEYLELLSSDNSGVRYWGLVGIRNLQENKIEIDPSLLSSLLEDESPSNQIIAAETILGEKMNEKAIEILLAHLKSDEQTLALFSARTLELLDLPFELIADDVQAVLEKYKNKDPNSKFQYSDYNYASFISWSLETIVENRETGT